MTPTPDTQIRQLINAVIESNSNFQETLSLLIALAALIFILAVLFLALRYGLLGVLSRKKPGSALQVGGEPSLIGALEELIAAMRERDGRMGNLADEIRSVSEDLQALTIRIGDLAQRLEKFLVGDK